MKKSRLPETDLACTTILPLDRQYVALRRLRDRKGGGKSYKPLKKNAHDVLNVQSPMFPAGELTDWNKIVQLIAKVARADELPMNLGVARALHDYCSLNRIIGRSRDMGSLPLISGSRVAFWHHLFLDVGGTAIIPFLEPRRKGGLSAEGRRFVFSLMRDHFDSHHPDLDSAELRIIQFTDGDDDQREVIIRAPEGPLFSSAEVHQMMQTTAQVWLDVLAEGEDEERRSAGGGKGSLL